MKIKFPNKVILFLLLYLISSSCTETYPLLTNTYEEAIIVEATLTNELKRQEIKISKTSRFEQKGKTNETGASVAIKDNLRNEYHFEEKLGAYVSLSEFQAKPKTEYSLLITTIDEKKYQSSNETLATATPMESVIASIVVNNKTERGGQIDVHSYDPSKTSKYYKYKYEESHKIVAPTWADNKAPLVSNQIVIVPNSTDGRICYFTKNNTDPILVSTIGLKEDCINFPIRFISDNSYIIGNRYSILMTQSVENLASCTFYKTLQELSSSSIILSPKQSGFINGNMRCISNSNDKVIAFFDVDSVSSKRIYFNYEDLFPGELKPPYYINCDPLCYGKDLPRTRNPENLHNDIELNHISFFT